MWVLDSLPVDGVDEDGQNESDHRQATANH